MFNFLKKHLQSLQTTDVDEIAHRSTQQLCYDDIHPEPGFEDSNGNVSVQIPSYDEVDNSNDIILSHNGNGVTKEIIEDIKKTATQRIVKSVVNILTAGFEVNCPEISFKEEFIWQAFDEKFVEANNQVF